MVPSVPIVGEQASVRSVGSVKTHCNSPFELMASIAPDFIGLGINRAVCADRHIALAKVGAEVRERWGTLMGPKWMWAGL